jgi:hypothetical protein
VESFIPLHVIGKTEKRRERGEVWSPLKKLNKGSVACVGRMETQQREKFIALWTFNLRGSLSVLLKCICGNFPDPLGDGLLRTKLSTDMQ